MWRNVNDTEGKPGMAFYAKPRPELFVMAMDHCLASMSSSSKGGSLYPECRSCVPGYVHVDARMLKRLRPIKKKRAAKRARPAGDAEQVVEELLVDTGPLKRNRRGRNDPNLIAEKNAVFSERDVLHPEIHKLIPHFWERFDYSFDTDGVAVSVHMRRPKPLAPSPPACPRQGHWCPRTTRWTCREELPARKLYGSAGDGAPTPRANDQ